MALDNKTINILTEKVGSEWANDLLLGLETSKNAYENVRATLKEGITEKEIMNAMHEALVRKDGSSIEYQYVLMAGERTALVGEKDAGHVLKYGEPVVVDIWFRYYNYYVDTTRTMFLGAPCEELRKMYQTTQKVLRKIEQTAKAGTRGNEIWKMATDVFDANGFQGLFPHHAGHRMDAEVFVDPKFLSDVEQPIEDGMIVALEPGIYKKGLYGVRLEDNYLVTEDGLVDLFDYTLDMDYFCVK